MTKTRQSAWTAFGLAVMSAALLLVRWYVLGAEMLGPPGASTWKITLAVAGEATATDAVLTFDLPPDFRHQHVLDERFHSQQLVHRIAKAREDRREIVWRRASMGAPESFRLNYSFRAVMGMRRPTEAMAQNTRRLDGPPSDSRPSDSSMKATQLIESDHREVSRQARNLVEEDMASIDQVQAFFEFVSRLETEPALGTQSALECLRSGQGDSGGKSRLLVALCRNRGIPARLVTGLALVGDREQGPHFWAEAWVNDYWVPMCPAYRYFGPRRFPRNYLVLQIGDDDYIRARAARFQYGFLVGELNSPANLESEDQPHSAAKAFWHRLSLYSLRPTEQHLVKFLLLLPVSALIVSILRTLVGVPTFGTFGPALLGLAFLDLRALRWGLVIFIVVVLLGWGMRRFLDRYHLLMVPRLSILLTLIVLLLIAVIVAANNFGVTTTQYIALFPLVILTHLVERFWTVEAEDSTAASFKTLAGTFAVAVTVSLSLGPDIVSTWLFRYPEIIGFVLAAQFLLGRYTGYRLTELYRFRDLLEGDEG